MSYERYLAGDPVVVTVALTGGVHGKEANPNIPETPEEIGAAAAACERAGASVVHLHARRPNGERSFATERFQEVDDAVRRYADDVIIQHSTGGTAAPDADRHLPLRTDPPPEMASLDMIETSRQQINEASAVIVLLSPEAKRSDGLHRQIALAQEYETPLLPVVIAGDPGYAAPYAVAMNQMLDLRDYDDGIQDVIAAGQDAERDDCHQGQPARRAGAACTPPGSPSPAAPATSRCWSAARR